MEYLLEYGPRGLAGDNLRQSPNRDCIEFAARSASDGSDGVNEFPVECKLPHREVSQSKIYSIVRSSMEQTQTNQRTVLGSIFLVSAGAVTFLLWLLYMHQAPAQFAGKYVFLPALNAVLNGLSAIALCPGTLLHQKTGPQSAPREHVAGVWIFVSLPGQLYR